MSAAAIATGPQPDPRRGVPGIVIALPGIRGDVVPAPSSRLLQY